VLEIPDQCVCKCVFLCGNFVCYFMLMCAFKMQTIVAVHLNCKYITDIKIYSILNKLIFGANIFSKINVNSM